MTTTSEDQPKKAREPRPKKFAPWRAATLASVYLLMGVHIAHWKIKGKTLAPLELNEVMYTLELGIVTAGFIFMAVAAVSILLFGRFFCSWGCHILALEDLGSWLLKKMRIRARPVRSRLLLLVPFAVLLYMFAWPQVTRIMAGEPFPEWRIVRHAEGWTSFSTTDFWRNLPGPWVIALTFFFCGFAIIYFLGSRSFCRYACPYGALFGLLDRASPGQIVAGENCEQCGICTSVCGSDVRVHEELKQFGKVVNPACLKDLDCVSVCPNRAVHFGFARPSGFKSWRSEARRKRYDFSLGEELLMLAVFLASVFVFRGLYDKVPFLMTLGIGVVLAYIVVLCLRLPHAEKVSLGRLRLKESGRMTTAGVGFALAACVLAVFVGHSAFIRYHEVKGQRAYSEFLTEARTGSVDSGTPSVIRALAHLETCHRWGLYRSTLLNNRLATLHLRTGAPERAEVFLQRMRDVDPAAAHELVGDVRSNQGDFPAAKAEYRQALAEDEHRISSRMALAALLANEGAFAEAAEHLEKAVAYRPDSHRAQYNLAVMLSQLGRHDEAIAHYETASGLVPRDPQIHNNLGFLLAQRGETAAAAERFRRAIELNPEFSHPHFNLGRLLLQEGRTSEAEEEFRTAARLDPKYAELLREMGLTF
jgi:tetratricopeptide (TPR) repeat protein/NAD-dependent dihydropyrimidine dehydrogenase PreA subunit